jgi:hypothetical protein
VRYSDHQTNPAIRQLIAERAYELWENQGRPSGYEALHWSQAEQEIMNSIRQNAMEIEIIRARLGRKAGIRKGA